MIHRSLADVARGADCTLARMTPRDHERALAKHLRRPVSPNEDIPLTVWSQAVHNHTAFFDLLRLRNDGWPIVVEVVCRVAKRRLDRVGNAKRRQLCRTALNALQRAATTLCGHHDAVLDARCVMGDVRGNMPCTATEEFLVVDAIYGLACALDAALDRVAGRGSMTTDVMYGARTSLDYLTGDHADVLWGEVRGDVLDVCNERGFDGLGARRGAND